MRTKRINGTKFEQMLRNGLINIRNNEEEINKANVFPVPDGDTGTNMALTLENGVKNCLSNENLGIYLSGLNVKMLLGARGNSGVILSQIFKGFSEELEKNETANVVELVSALIRGYKTAYNSVTKPVEGTILTVAREGVEGIILQIPEDESVEEFFSVYLTRMRESLSYTPELLPMLKEAGVVDSGAMGYIFIIEGMVKALNGEQLELINAVDYVVPNTISTNASFFNETSKFEYGYCMEFLLQLLNDSKYSQTFNIDDYIENLKQLGDSLVCIQDHTRIKVHIHTHTPAKVITLSQEYGEFVSFKLENMQIQHNEFIEKKKNFPHKPFAIIAVVNGEGTINLFKDLGVDYVINGGSTMNTSTEEFVNAFKEINADNIVVLPNNKNIISAAKQAVDIYGKGHVAIIPTTSIPEGSFAIAMDVGDSTDYDYRIDMMKSGTLGVETVSITKILRECVYKGIECKIGDYILLDNDDPIVAAHDYINVLKDGLSKINNIEDKTCAIAFKGKAFKEEDEEVVNQIIQEYYPNLQVEFIEGEQEIYELIIGLI